MGKTNMIESKTASFAKGLVATAIGLGALTSTAEASAQEILLTGPLAGAPAVRKLRLYRDKRFSIGPVVSFTLLDEYQRTMLAGLKLSYNFTDWFALELWGQAGAFFIDTHLTEETQAVNQERRDDPTNPQNAKNLKITAANLGEDFTNQLGHIEAIAGPQLTFVPFRGKIAFFEGIYVDTDLYLFGGPAAVAIGERKNCGAAGELSCTNENSFTRGTRWKVAPMFGLGLSFYTNKWNSFQIEWRAVPFSWNTSGFSIRQDGSVANSVVDEDDQQFHINQMITLTYNFFLPMDYRVSE